MIGIQNNGLLTALQPGGVNQELLNRIALIEQEIEALKNTKASKAGYGLSKISGATTVTEDNGLVLGAREKNAAIDGTLANSIKKNRHICAKYAYFSEVPIPQFSYDFFSVVNNGDPDAPVKNVVGYWNGITFGVGNRVTVIAFNAFGTRETMYIKQKHDDRWYGWYKIAGVPV